MIYAIVSIGLMAMTGFAGLVVGMLLKEGKSKRIEELCSGEYRCKAHWYDGSKHHALVQHIKTQEVLYVTSDTVFLPYFRQQ